MIIVGWGKGVKPLGEGFFHRCANCDNARRFVIVESSRKVSLYFVPVAKWNRRYFYVCPVCSQGVEIPSRELAQKILVAALRDPNSVPNSLTETLGEAIGQGSVEPKELSAPRDADGILTGRLEYPEATFEVMSQIPPFFFPCDYCNGFYLHVVGQYPADESYVCICNTCTTANLAISKAAVAKLESGVIPREICIAYAKSPSRALPYTSGFRDCLKRANPHMTPEEQQRVDRLLTVYRLETPV